MLHGLLLLVLLTIVKVSPSVLVDEPAPIDHQVVFIQEPGPGGGGGGSPEPAPPRPLMLPRPRPREPVPVASEPLVLEAPPLFLALNAPVYVNDASAVQASGRSMISLSPIGGGGSRGGVGDGKGSGVGAGEERGFGGDAYRPGSGVTVPVLVHSEKPSYTSAALQAKIEGQVTLDVEALRAARLWRFLPATHDGEPVATIVTILLRFSLY